MFVDTKTDIPDPVYDPDNDGVNQSWENAAMETG